MYAYRLPQCDQPMEAAEHPTMRRLLPAGPFQFSPSPQGGTFVTWKDAAGKAAPESSFGHPRECADGVFFYPPLGAVGADDLIRKAPPAGLPVEMASGVTLHIAFAAASPRKLVFEPTGIKTGDYLTEYARLAEDLRARVDKEGDVNMRDPLLGRVVLLAVQQSYRVTEEMLTDLGWLSTSDFGPIAWAAWGYDPKAERPLDGGQ